jgi:hypothetical protein
MDFDFLFVSVGIPLASLMVSNANAAWLVGRIDAPPAVVFQLSCLYN